MWLRRFVTIKWIYQRNPPRQVRAFERVFEKGKGKSDQWQAHKLT
jgi:hypothetical protein